MRAVVDKAKQLGGYKDLSKDDQQVLLDALQHACDEKDTGAVRQVMLHVHDVWTSFDRISHEVISN